MTVETRGAVGGDDVPDTLDLAARGALAISPQDADPRNYPLYQREPLRRSQAPLKPSGMVVAERMVADW